MQSTEHLRTEYRRSLSLSSVPMSAKYYAHFIAQSDGAMEYSEYRGVVELLGAKGPVQGSREIARMLAQSFDLEEMDIQVLQWHQLH
jgi:hypothetical protein